MRDARERGGWGLIMIDGLVLRYVSNDGEYG